MEKTCIIERRTVGNSTKVSAIDPQTGIEASLVVPTALPEKDQNTLAMNKLTYVLKKHENNKTNP